MGLKKKNLETLYAQRRRSVLRKIKGDALLIPSAPQLRRSPDEEVAFRQDANFYYLTGLNEPDSTLLLLGKTRGPRSVLFLRDRDPQVERWQGERLGIKRAKQRFQVDEVRSIQDLERDFPKLVTDCRVLHFNAGVNPGTDALVWKSYRSLHGPRLNFPHTIQDARLILSEMRFVKDRYEIQALEHVIDITAHSFIEIAPRLKNVSSEAHAARILEEYFVKMGASGPAFATIVAAGKNATCLHYTPRSQPLWHRELVLIDAGAQFRGYAADITRTIPVSGRFLGAQADLYDVVLSALKAAIQKAKPEATLEVLQQAAVRELTKGLVSLKILRGDVSNLVAQESYKRFYMHTIGHSLGLDVHDTTPFNTSKPDQLLPGSSRPFVPGVVVTIEPGLYLDAKDPKVPKRFRGIGIRLEEDILITANGCEVLSHQMPIEREDIEAITTA